MTAKKPNPSSRPWYREPYVWLVIGGPLVVVVASIVTFGIAARNQDPVLLRDAPLPTREVEALRQMTPEQRAQAEAALEPAVKARNHAATPKANSGQ
jgi:uncharacterized protein